jgi:tetratricopeptide (TPR) repeat protein/transcriptional regulator with XRE-family HTH domain
VSETQGPITDTFGAVLRRHRLALGLSQEELAGLSGLSVRAIANMERGRTTRPHRFSVQSLGDALGLPVLDRRELDRAARVPAAGLTHPPTVESLPVPRQLPASVPNFVGRTRELKELTGLLDRGTRDAAGTVVISAIGGTAGVGKTALAVHWAHQSADRFPDGQLYVNLAGFGPSGPPLPAGQAVRGFLDALGVRPEQIPQVPDGQAGLYRSLLAGRRMLVVLDNAADEEQVRPLLPGSAGCLAVVTSRRQLTALAAAEGAALITLEYLPDAEARQLLTDRLGAARVTTEPRAARDLVTVCAGLPLALSITAARAAARPHFPLAALAAELADAASRLDVLDAGDPGSGVRAAFSWSYEQLGGEAARMFRLLGLHPGPDISIAAAASLAGTGEPEARRQLGELARAHLITEHLPGRYALHDLLRAYAADQARAHESPADGQAAVGRVLDYYLHTAAVAALLLNPATEPVTLAPLRPGAAARQLAHQRQAQTWFEEEHQVLLAAVTFAAASGFDSHAWQLPWAMAAFLQTRGQWQDWAATQRTALAAATRVGDTAAQALASRILANACSYLGDHDQSRRYYASSLALYQRLGDRRGEAKIHEGLCWLADGQGSYADALEHAERALRLFQAIGDKAGQAAALNSVGWYHGLLGDYEQARSFGQLALTMSAEAGYRRFEGNAWDSLGYAEHHLGNLPEAAACYQRALSIFREAGDRFVEADVLTHLGDARLAAGEVAQAQEAWRQAITILDDIQHPNADKVRSKLASTNDHKSPKVAPR